MSQIENEIASKRASIAAARERERDENWTAYARALADVLQAGDVPPEPALNTLAELCLELAVTDEMLRNDRKLIQRYVDAQHAAATMGELRAAAERGRAEYDQLARQIRVTLWHARRRAVHADNCLRGAEDLVREMALLADRHARLFERDASGTPRFRGGALVTLQPRPAPQFVERDPPTNWLVRELGLRWQPANAPRPVEAEPTEAQPGVDPPTRGTRPINDERRGRRAGTATDRGIERRSYPRDDGTA